VPRARFGTDGIRGVAESELTSELAFGVGRAAARVLGAPAFLIGRDTRRSGPDLQAAFSEGAASEGADVVDVGVLPTPALAFLSEVRDLPAVVVSASHNPFEDNGIKLFGPGGAKLATDLEVAIEAELDRILDSPDSIARSAGARRGTLSSDAGAADEYVARLCAALGERRFDGIHIVLDCANGAAFEVAPRVFASLGAKLVTLANEPDGTNINAGCGSTNPSMLAARVVESGADLGLAFDGDADRLIAVDGTGAVVDGDVLLALFALDLAERGELPGNAVVVTVMTNLGFRLAMAARGIGVRETPVGDRAVLMALDTEALALGGEPSGHIVFRHLATTGDGILTGLSLVDLVLRSGKPLAELAHGLIERVPQLLVNVEVDEPHRLAGADAVWDAVADVEAALGERGRVVLRASGTEPLVRVMVEAATEDEAAEAAQRLRDAVEGSLGNGR
jgi:phosphoglucosamine mutase